ncbi:hypothetical protein E4U42_004073 [Claviceps africana]|uniref:Uncharacterized protein n=1 Tax=Claviceps africana TaxID=83212 RepID=A0A8K0JCK3_9HYPO|nr:hypothetical protein E4U42_004073 [Claviceps africana]
MNITRALLHNREPDWHEPRRSTESFVDATESGTKLIDIGIVKQLAFRTHRQRLDSSAIVAWPQVVIAYIEARARDRASNKTGFETIPRKTASSNTA